MTLPTGTRVRVRSADSIVRALHGVEGKIVPTNYKHSEGKVLMEFDSAVDVGGRVPMYHLWVNRDTVEVLS